MAAEHAVAFKSAFVGPMSFAMFFGSGMGVGGTLSIQRSQTLGQLDDASEVAVAFFWKNSYVAVGWRWTVHAEKPRHNRATKRSTRLKDRHAPLSHDRGATTRIGLVGPPEGESDAREEAPGLGIGRSHVEENHGPGGFRSTGPFATS